MISAGRLAALTALSPMPLLGVLALSDEPDILPTVGLTPWFSVLSLAFATLVVVAIARLRKPHLLLSTGSSSWLLVALSGGGLYLVGSYYRASLLHWGSLPLIYIGIVTYLGGKRFSSYVLLGIGAIATLALPLFLGTVAVYIAAELLAIVSGLLVLALRRAKGGGGPDCQRCDSYRGSGNSFCDFCGKNLSSPLNFASPWRRIALVVLVTIVTVVLVSGTELPIVSASGSGLLVSNYRVSGLESATPLPTYPGWTVFLARSFANSTVRAFDYSLKGKVLLNLTLALSASSPLSVREALGSHPHLRLITLRAVTPNQQTLNYSWSEGNDNFSGTLFTFPLTYLSSQNVQESYASFFFSQQSTNSGTVLTNYLPGIVGITLGDLEASKAGYSILTNVVGPFISNFSYVPVAVVLVFLCAVSGLVRNTDTESAKLHDNSISLSLTEFEFLAVISAQSRKSTGKALMDMVKPVEDWEGFSSLLEKLRRLGLVKREVVTRSGVPREFWVSRVGT